MRHTSLMVASVVAVISVSPASATMRISGDPGGLIIAYAERFAAARASGEPVIIDGACLSACTLAVGILPRGQVCATPNAVLGFHAAWRPTGNGGKTTSSVATQAMYELYPASVRDWINRRGGLSGRMIYLKGRELAAIVPACDGSSTAKAEPALRGQRAARAVRHDQYPHATLAAQPLR
jgi:hypothetical protein